MDKTIFIEKLRKELEKLPGFKENDSQFTIHCFNCESNRDHNKPGHLYISKIKDGNPIFCMKCDLSSNKLNIDLMNKLKIDDSGLKQYVLENFKIKHTHIINLDERNKRVDYKPVTNTVKYDKFKMSALSDRLLYDIDNEKDILTYRIISNISRFIKSNDIDLRIFNQKELSLIPILDKYYIGFLSYFGNVISFRNMTGNDNYPRYINFIINKEIKRSFFYTPAISINPLTENPKITVAEGAIDILAIHLNNKCFDEANNIYVASGSVGAFRSAVKNALNLSGYYGSTISLFLDNEDLVDRVSKYDFDKVLKSLKGFEKDFKITAYINLQSKDFGDLREKITIAKCNLNSLMK